jgi:hypothetical protein
MVPKSWYGPDNWGSNASTGHHIQTGSVSTQPPIQQVLGTLAQG